MNSKSACKLIKGIPGLRLLISSLPGSASRTHVEALGRPHDSTSILEALPGKPNIKRHSTSILYIQPPPNTLGHVNQYAYTSHASISINLVNFQKKGQNFSKNYTDPRQRRCPLLSTVERIINNPHAQT